MLHASVKTACMCEDYDMVLEIVIPVMSLMKSEKF